MSCFWIGIRRIQQLRDATRSPSDVLAYLKEHNRLPLHVHWQKQPISKQLMLESFNTIKQYKRIENGHLTSSCDPFLLLCCELFKCNIRFNYLGNMISIEYMSDTKSNETIPTYNFTGSSSHFS